jgi:hypothetical protein
VMGHPMAANIFRRRASVHITGRMLGFYETSGVPLAINIALEWVELHIGRRDAGAADLGGHVG